MLPTFTNQFNINDKSNVKAELVEYNDIVLHADKYFVSHYDIKSATKRKKLAQDSANKYIQY